MIARNPYVIGVPLTDDAGFYGRQEFFQFIRDVLEAQKQNVIVLYGQRRIGKTSVLHRAGRWLEAQHRFFPVYFDLQGKERLSLGEVLENLAQTIARRLGVERPDLAQFDDDGRYFSEHFLPQAFSRLDGRRLVLLVDEFDVLGDELASPKAASETLFPYLQDLIVTQPQIGFVFVVGRRIEELATHFQAIFKQAVYRRVGRLQPEESRSLIVEPVRGILTYDDAAIHEIQTLAAGHPYFTQLICFEAFNAVKGNGQVITRDVIETVVARAIESGHGALNWFWEGLPRAERFILSAVAHVSDDTGTATKEDVRSLLEEHRILLSGLELKDAPDRLVEWEMLRREGADAYQFVVELVRRWVLQEHPLSSARRDIDYVSKRAVRLFENAREAHSEGDLPYARDEYRRALKANPNHSGAQLGLALVLYELGEIDESIAEFERAYVIDEMSARDGLVRARLAKGKALEDQKVVTQAIQEYEQVLKLAPAQESAIRRVGTIWQAQAEVALASGDLVTASAAFREVLKRDARVEAPARIEAAFAAHAEQLANAGKLEQAAANYAGLLELLPDSQDAKTRAASFWFRCGESLEDSGNLEGAIGWYTRVLKIFPEDAVVAARLEAARRKVEERNTVARVFEEAIAAHRDGRTDDARRGFKRLIQLDVLSYEGQNIAALLSETVQKAVPPPAPKAAKARKAAPKPEAPVEPPRQEEAPPVESAPAPEESTPTYEPPSVVIDRQNRSGRRLSAAAAMIGGIAVFGLWPSSVVGIIMAPTTEVKPTKEAALFATPMFSSDWRRAPIYIGSGDYTWHSSDDKIATVSSYGIVTGVAPGKARITASWASHEASTEVTVLPWDVPAMKANLDRINFYLGESNTEMKDRKYQTEFDVPSKGNVGLWAEFTLDVHETTKDRALSAPIGFKLYAANDTPIDSLEWRLAPLPVEWSTATWSVRLPDLRTFKPGMFRFDLIHEGRVLGSASFQIRQPGSPG